MHLSLLPIQAGLSETPLHKLAQNGQTAEPDKIKELSRQFEAILLRQMLQEVQKTLLPSDYVKDSAVKAIYQDMIVAQLADQISRSESFGIARSLQVELSRQLAPDQKSISHGNSSKP